MYNNDDGAKMCSNIRILGTKNISNAPLREIFVRLK